MKISKRQTLGEFSATVASALRSKGIDTVLTGGAVVSIYTNNRYQSSDADFISPNDQVDITKALLSLGFKRLGKDYSHSKSDFYVEFPPGPLAVGSQRIEADTEMEINGNRLKLLSPSQSVMDRLAAYFFWKDRQALDQAIWIAQEHPIQVQQVRSWAKKEGQEEPFKEFLRLLQKSKK